MVGSNGVGSLTSRRIMASNAGRVAAPFLLPKASQARDIGNAVDLTK